MSLPDEPRPIGTTFEWWAAPDECCAKRVWRVYTYRIVAHDHVRGGMAERVEATDIKEYPAREWLLLGDRLISVPPLEIRHLIPGWDRFAPAGYEIVPSTNSLLKKGEQSVEGGVVR